MSCIRNDSISVNKECNPKRHYQTKHAAKYEDLYQIADKIAILKRAMAKQQTASKSHDLAGDLPIS